ncbi:hypothetical protein K1719_033094 [Acacia pycnantha]|nr:hypothetical protein K1719_033094 [Acacia pycnantha]
MESSSSREEPTSWDELYNINLMSSEFFLKFRKEIQGVVAEENKVRARQEVRLVGPDGGEGFVIHDGGWQSGDVHIFDREIKEVINVVEEIATVAHKRRQGELKHGK